MVLGSVAPFLPLFGSAASASRKLKNDIDKPSPIDGTSEEGDLLPVDTPGFIEFQEVSFAYSSRPDNPVLKSVDLSFPQGKHTAIVGLSGSGKSTVAGLISRLHDPTSGSILVDGRDIRSLNVRNLRSLIGFVPQEPSLFDRTLFENIALGLVNSGKKDHEHLQEVLLGPDLERIAKEVEAAGSATSSSAEEIFRLVHNAAELAEVSTFVDELGEGWATRVGSGGLSVSGGQRQRIALARALVKDPRILVLDEATAALDSSTERKIQAAVYKVAANRTVISIAHRLSTIRDVDNIAVMKDGQVMEQGTFSELAASEGAFSRMVKLQGLDSETDTEDGGSSIVARKDSPGEKQSILSGAEKTVDSSNCNATYPTSPPPESTALKRQAWPIVKGFSILARPNLRWIILAVFAAVIVGSTFSSAGLIFGHTVGALSPCSNTIDHILWAGKFFGGLLFMLACVEFFANFLSWSSFGLVAEKLVHQVRVLVFRSLFEKEVEWHRAEGRTPAALLSVITKDSTALQGFSGSIIGTIFSITVNFLIAVIMSHIIAWKIALVFLVTVPILLGAGVMQIRAIARFDEKHAKAFSSAVAITVETVSQIKTVATLGLENEVFRTYRRTLAAPKKAIIGASLYTNIWLALNNSVGFLIYTFAYWWGSKLIIDGEYSQTQFFIILVAILISAQLWGQMFSLAPEVSRAKMAAGRLLDLINSTENNALDSSRRNGDDKSKDGGEKDIEATAPFNRSTPSSKGVALAFNSVTFTYPSKPSAPVLSDVSFTIKPGQFVGLVGPSGAGKSTIMALAQQLYMCQQGSITMDGNPNLSLFKDDIAVVPQDSRLFSGSIRFNISLGARRGHEPTDEEIREACRVANMDDVVSSLPDGYDTECGPSSSSHLSGGQKQRLAIARALVRRPRLLLLDESTSALDAQSEASVQEGLTKIMQEGRVSVLAITHRLRTVMRADAIVVVEAGRIVDVGKHGELVSRCESYRRNALGQMLD